MHVVVIGIQATECLTEQLSKAGHRVAEAGSKVRQIDAPDVVVLQGSESTAEWLAMVSQWQRDEGTRVVAIGSLPRSDLVPDVQFPVGATSQLVEGAFRPPIRPTELRLSSGVVNLETGTIERREGSVVLTEREVELLAYLGARPGQIIPRDELLSQVWKYADNIVTRVIDATVNRLRAKIEAPNVEPEHILTVRGTGYRFVPLARDSIIQTGNLGHPVDTFFGRKPSLERLEALFASSTRLVTVTGPAGMGKTRIATRYARSSPAWPGGAWFCDLTHVTTRADILRTAGTALGLRLLRGSEEGETDFCTILKDRGRLLLVLDNLERVAADAAAAASAWLAEVPELRILATSRERLRVSGEAILELPPMADGDGVDLFRDRAGLAGANVPSEEEAAPIVAELDGLPLAIELAAGLLDILRPADLFARLKRPLDTLIGLGRDRPERHRSLRAAVQSSWEILEESEQRALCRCVVFSGGFSVEGAEALLTGVVPNPLQSIRSLRGKSLLRRLEGASDRFDLYRPVRDFALERLSDEDLAEVTERHRQWYAGAWGRRCPRGTVPRTPDIQWLFSELGNAMVAFDASLSKDAEGAAVLASGLYQVFGLRGPVDRAARILEQVLSEPSLAPEWRAHLLRARVAVLLLLGELSAVADGVEVALLAARQIQDDGLEGRLYAHLGAAYLCQGRSEAAVDALTLAVAAHRKSGNQSYLAMALADLAAASWDMGDVSGAEGAYEEAEAVCRQLGNRRIEAFVLASRGLFEVERGGTRGLERIDQAVAIHEAADDPLNRAMALETKARAWLTLRDPWAALEILQASTTARRLRGEAQFSAIHHQRLGVAWYAVGEREAAMEHFETALADRRATGEELICFLETARLLCTNADLGKGVPALRDRFADVGERTRGGRLLRVANGLAALNEGPPIDAREHRQLAVAMGAPAIECHYADVEPFLAALDQGIRDRTSAS